MLVLTACVGRGLPLSLNDAGFVDSGVGSPRDAGFVDAGPRDGGSRDAGIAVECVQPVDCVAPVAPQSIVWCAGVSAWSCIEGRCAWDCYNGGRTCERTRDGCLQCDDGRRPTCPDRTCDIPIGATTGVEEAICARAFLEEISSCFGEWVELDDGTLCGMQWLPTGAPRAVLVCGRCQTTLWP